MRITDGLRSPSAAMRVPGATAICLGILTIALMTSSAFVHWFVIPLFACGLLCSLDGIGLLENGGRNLFEPVSLLGGFGVYFFYIAPLLHVGRDYWFINRYFAPTDRPEDWRTWLGWMGIVNLCGLVIYRICHTYFAKAGIHSRNWPVYRLKMSTLHFYAYPLLAATFLLQLYIYANFGGLAGYVNTYGEAGRVGQSGFQGMGWILCIAESFPMLLLIAVIGAHKHALRRLPNMALSAMLAGFAVLVLLFGGLRGSRSNTVLTLVYAVGIIHAMVRRLPPRFFVVFGGGLAIFMYAYGFYKVSPVTFATAMTSSESREMLAQSTGRTMDGLLLGDLERSDIQAYLLFRIFQDGSQVRYAYGATYIEGALGFIPRVMVSYRPAGKTRFGTNAIFGEGAYAEGRFAATKVYGLAGETMLNFGLYGIPVAFAALGMLAGRLRALSRRIQADDSRQYMIPILSLGCITALSSDVDNLLFVVLQHALMPCILIWCASSRTAAVLSVGEEEVRAGRASAA